MLVVQAFRCQVEIQSGFLNIFTKLLTSKGMEDKNSFKNLLRTLYCLKLECMTLDRPDIRFELKISPEFLLNFDQF
jgi:hypothetical protein